MKGSPAVHRKQFTANNSPQGRFTAGKFTTEAIHSRAIHRKNNSPHTIHRKKIKSRAIQRRGNSPQTIHRNFFLK
jgi:hypothetical protein